MCFAEKDINYILILLKSVSHTDKFLKRKNFMVHRPGKSIPLLESHGTLCTKALKSPTGKKFISSMQPFSNSSEHSTLFFKIYLLKLPTGEL